MKCHEPNICRFVRRFAVAGVLLWGCFVPVKGAVFGECFHDSTLRVDYVFGGGPGGVRVLLEGESRQAGWAGRRHRLTETPLAGNGSLTMTDAVTGDTLYVTTFSSLFHEWLSTPEAAETDRAFEHSVLAPLPRRETDITLTLRDSRRRETARHTHRFRPGDELVACRGAMPFPHEYLHRGGSPAEAIDVAVVAEGYRAEEMDAFLVHARRFTDEILRYEPFASCGDRFNFVAVMTPSRESGVSVPLRGEWRDTAVASHYSTFHAARYLTVPRVHRLHELLEGIPYEYILVVANTEDYGGGGIYNCYQIAAADHALTLPVAVHEFGHSFGGLGDEYQYGDEGVYPLDVEPWEPNITTGVDFGSKWADMVGEEAGVGLHEGAGYRADGIWRPAETCRMRDNLNPDFCRVCERALRRVIDFLTTISSL